MTYYDISSHNFDNVTSYKVACLCCKLVPVMLFWMLPSEQDLKEISKAKSPEARASNRIALVEKDTIDISQPRLNSSGECIELIKK